MTPMSQPAYPPAQLPPPGSAVVAKQLGFSLLELMAVVSIVGALAALLLIRLVGSDTTAKVGACHTYRADIEVQAEIWRHNRGSWPASDLSDIGGNPAYFPEGLPACPVDSSSYTIDPNGRVVGHDHP